MRNKLYFGDNLEVMREMDNEIIDLCCTDPPFNSGRNYNIFLDSEAQKQAFKDIWKWDDSSEESREDIKTRSKQVDGEIYKSVNETLTGYDYILQKKQTGWRGSMRSYLAFMAPRLVEIHRLLKNSGSFYLHCDPSASHYLKTLLDTIFDSTNLKENNYFRTELIWWYHWGRHTPKNWNRKHDVILYYCKNPKLVFFDGTRVRVPYGGTSGGMTQDPRYNKSYHEDGKLPEDVLNIPIINTRSKERTGYPTQKPLALYQPIIKSSSNEGDVILDPFAGCGTTIDAAQSLNRKWIGIDITLLALEPIKRRIYERHNLKSVIDYDMEGYPTNMQEVELLVNNQKRYHDFSDWAVTRLGLKPTKKTGDGGYDGVGHFTLWIPEGMEQTSGTVMAEVKSGKPSINQVRSFCHSMNENNAIAGVFITLHKVSAGMRELADRMGTFEHNGKEYKRLQFWQITQEYFDNPDSINRIIKLPKSVVTSKKMDPYIVDDQIDLLEAVG